MIFINFKTYPEAIGKRAHQLVAAIDMLPENLRNRIVVAPALPDLGGLVVAFPRVQFCSQHTDIVSSGSSTGYIVADHLKSLGVRYTLLNHSEHRVSLDSIDVHIETLMKHELSVVVCCETVEEAELIAKSSPHAIAYEPKDLIGSGISVTTRPDAVRSFISAIPETVLPFIGAGVSSVDDISTGIALGGKGFLLASAFVKAKDPFAIAESFSKALESN